jgi:hypothetical protein
MYELVERNHRLGRRALDHQRPCPLQKLGREVSGRGGRADELEEAAEEPGGVARPSRPVLRAPRHELVGGRSPARDAERRGLDHRQRAQAFRLPRSREQRDDAAVRVPHEVRPRPHELLEPDRLVLEVDVFDVRSRREPAPVRRHDLEALVEGFLGVPGQVRVDDGTVN